MPKSLNAQGSTIRKIYGPYNNKKTLFDPADANLCSGRGAALVERLHWAPGPIWAAGHLPHLLSFALARASGVYWRPEEKSEIM